jgi:hypothetical protein
MRTVLVRLLTAGCIAVLCSPAPALARSGKTHAPPGNSGVDEYLEVVPEGGGNRPASGGGGRSAQPLSRKQQNALRAYGRDGKAVARLARSTAPARDRRARSRSRSLGAAAADSPDSGAFAAIKRTVSALGGGFLVFFLMVLAGGLVFGLRRRQRPSA